MSGIAGKFLRGKRSPGSCYAMPVVGVQRTNSPNSECQSDAYLLELWHSSAEASAWKRLVGKASIARQPLDSRLPKRLATT
ncbi:hypothetical protein DOTSEDRAFT_48035 [Dothistroma septosporum NZE10]|uniref:Uncharacterized protein n=1 Tax=Dothistroma septosporum (strain NZE10 / CBS 128990) TaxID=675120 RepID=M2WKR2_DOTSN|nr:hypothetical protein DOTSEDRAFT_48035 [Dothistroma septosporum NZE10]